MNTASLQSSKVAALLRESCRPDLRRLEVEETTEEVVLLGVVASYYLKQLAQECIRPAIDGRKLHNRVAVDPRAV